MQEYLRRKKLGEIALSNGLCNICRKHPIWTEKSKTRCEHCFITARKAQQRLTHRYDEKRKIWQRNYHATENGKIKSRLYQREYRKTDKYKKYYAEYYSKNIDKMHEKDRNWAKNNPDKVRAKAITHTNRRRYQKKHNGIGGHISTNQWKELVSIFGNQCISCGATTNLELDHIIPLSKNGEHSVHNVQPLCHACNSRKGVDIIDYRISYFSSWT